MTKRQKDKPYLANHQRSWIWGRHAVCETLGAGRWPIRELYLAEELPVGEIAAALEKGERLGTSTVLTSHERLHSLCGNRDHQGYLARMGPFPYARMKDILAPTSATPLYIVLDGIRDAHNFGAIIRSAAALGASAVIAGGAGQSPINGQAARTSAGAVNRIPIALEHTLADVLQKLRAHGVPCIAAVASAETPVWACDFLKPTAVLFGNEGRGIEPEIVALCDSTVSVPLDRPMDSLNVSAAAVAVLYEAWRQRSAAAGMTHHSEE